jgi:exosortase/archaeosortase family protein
MIPPWKGVMLFLALFAGLQFAYTSAWQGKLERFVIEELTVRPVAALLNAMDPHLGVQAHGSRLAAPGGGLNVLGGCEGTDVALLLCSAFMAARIGWRARCLGLVIGLLWVFALNQARIIALFHAYRWHPPAFEILHGSLLPLGMVLLAAAFFLRWTARHPVTPA